MNCEACENAENNPLTGRYRAGCQGCQARALANGHELFISRTMRVKSPEYAAALTRVFGEGNEHQGHERVREWFRKIQQAKGTT